MPKQPDQFPKTVPELLRLFAILSIAWLSVSCISSEEEVWLNRNGSGRAKLSLTVPNAVLVLQGGEQGASRLIHQLLDGDSSVSGLKTSFRRGEKRTTIEMSFHFDSAARLYDSLDKSATDAAVPEAIQHIIGKTSVRRSGLGITGERRMNFAKAIPGIGLLSAGGREQTLLTTIHLPFKPSAHNAIRTRNKGRTLVWETTLADAINAPYSQEVTYRIPPSLIVCMVLVFVSGLLLLRHLRRKRKPPLAADGALSITTTQTNWVSTINL